MPIYEYYCKECQGQFRHLARKIDSPAPACPRCGNEAVKRVITTAHTLHNPTHHQNTLRQEADQVDANNMVEIAEFLKNSGRLDDTDGLYGSRVYRELLHRRAEGAADQDLSDLVNDLTAEMHTPPGGEISGAMLFSEQIENRMTAEGPPERINPEHEDKKLKESQPEKQRADDLGWV